MGFIYRGLLISILVLDCIGRKKTRLLQFDWVGQEDDCTTPHYQPGSCIALSECGHIRKLLTGRLSGPAHSYLRRSVCRFSGGLPHVCCPGEPVVLGWTGWTSWTFTTPCSARCGGGSRRRTRFCRGQDRDQCRGERVQEVSCNEDPCVISGGWSSWQSWSSCSASCGGGSQSRSRRCDSPPASGGGRPCRGGERQERQCGGEECPGLPAQCGERVPGITQFRVVGGVPARLHAHPWIAALAYSDGQVKCGGTLVTARHVITAAHCVNDQLSTVILGEHNLKQDQDKASPQTFNIVNVTKHGEYNKRTQDNDIAIIKLDREVIFNVGIRPACLPSREDNLRDDKFEDAAVVVAGWGAVKFRGPTSERLMEGTIKVVTNEECSDKFKAFRRVKINDKKLCARDLNNRIDACQGDSGGPLVAEKLSDDGKYRFYLVGVVSFGYRCAVPGFPGVYTRLTEYDDWIRQVTLH